VPSLLEPFGEAGSHFVALSHLFRVGDTGARFRVATGRAGDVFVCHPFLVHRATWPHLGKIPRIVAQPAIARLRPSHFRREAVPVERAILEGLDY